MPVQRTPRDAGRVTTTHDVTPATAERASHVDASSARVTTPVGVMQGRLPRVTALDVESLARADRTNARGIAGATVIAQVPLGVPSPSGICQLASGETLVADDDKGIALVRSDGEAVPLVKDAKDVEGLCASADGKTVYAVREGTGKVFAYDVKRDGQGALLLEQRGEPRALPKIGEIANKGWEGIAFLPKELAGTDADCIVAVHEGHPRRIGVYELPDLEHGHAMKVPGAADELLPDLADVAVDPTNGHIFVVSDEGQRVVELAFRRDQRAAGGKLLDKPKLDVVSSFALPVARSDKPEGLCFDDKNRLWVSLDGIGQALVLDLQRG